jgi:hypothetical protein
MGVFREGPGKKKVLMVIGSLCPISEEWVIRGLRWGIGPEGGEALSSHHIRATGQNYDFSFFTVAANIDFFRDYL